MRRFFLMCLLPIFLATGVFAQPQADEYPYDLTYFLPEGSHVYDPQVPTPEKILGFQLGEQHAGWDQVVEYMRTLARCSDRVTIRETGRTYQHRPFYRGRVYFGQEPKKYRSTEGGALKVERRGEIEKRGDRRHACDRKLDL